MDRKRKIMIEKIIYEATEKNEIGIINFSGEIFWFTGTSKITRSNNKPCVFDHRGTVQFFETNRYKIIKGL